jgi:hypothetical protein
MLASYRVARMPWITVKRRFRGCGAMNGSRENNHWRKTSSALSKRLWILLIE